MNDRLFCRARDEQEDSATMPWALIEPEVRSGCGHRLSLIRLEDFVDDDGGEFTRRFRVLFRRDSL